MQSRTIRAAVCVLAVAAATAGAAGAETRIRVRNDGVMPAEVTVDKKSREIRARKSSNFPLTSPVVDLKVAFANGDVNYGEIDIGPFLAVENPKDGNTYFCMSVDEDDFDLLSQADCAEWVVED